MKHVPPPTGELIPSDLKAQDLPVAIGRLRKEARDEINRLIQFLDTTDNYVSRELEDQVDDGPIDDNELDGPENGEDEESEPNEPSLGSGAVSEWSNQEDWARQPAEMRISSGVDLEDEHDGAEPDQEGDDSPDDEPSLGWTIDGVSGSQSGDDRELQDHASVRPKKRRKKLDRAISVEDRGYGGRKIIGNLSDPQRDAFAGRLNRYGPISLK